MLKKMRRRFISLAMTAFSAVVLLLLVMINLGSYFSSCVQLDALIERLDQYVIEGNTEDTDSADPSAVPPSLPYLNAFPDAEDSDRSSDSDGTGPDEDISEAPGSLFGTGAADLGPYSVEFQYMIRFFTVSYDAEGNQTSINQDFIASVSGEDAVLYAEAVLNRKAEQGFYHRFRYRIFSDEAGTTVIFLNAEQNLVSFTGLLVITGSVALVCMLAVFILLLIFSGKAIAPYIRNLETQKEFITNASHELKTPLTSISTSVDVLGLELPDNEWIDNIRVQSSHLSRLISNLVTLSRLDEEHPFAEKTEISLSDMAWEIAEPFSARARASGKQFSSEIEDGLTVTGDEGSLQQIFSVLLDNAVKYSDTNGSISLKVDAQGKKRRIRVSNTCQDPSSLDVSRLFDRFYRGDSSHSVSDSSGAGSYGIGLSIAKAAAEANGGRISAGTEKNTICFTVIL